MWLFAANFMCNLFELGDPYNPQQWRPRVFEVFQMDVQTAINNTLIKIKKDGLHSTGGFLYGYPNPGDTYDRAFALHGKVFSFFYYHSTSDLNTFLRHGYWAMSLCLATILTILAFFVKKHFGWGAAVTLVIILNLSDWLVFIGRNMYEVYFLRLLPFVLSFILFQFVIKGTRFRFYHFLIVVGLANLTLSLCCNEFVTNIVLSVGVGPIFYGILNRQPFKRVAYWTFLSVLVAMMAVAVGVVATAIQGYLFYNNSDKALIVFQAIYNRSFGSSDTIHDWTAPKEISIFQIFEQYLTLPVASIPFYQNRFPGYHIFLTLFAFVFALLPCSMVCLLDGRIFPRIEKERQKMLALTAATLWGLAASLSWAFLMKGFMWHHIHMAALTFYIPYLPMLYILLGKNLSLISLQCKDWMEARQRLIAAPTPTPTKQKRR
ncbi:MAG: hypothetical protein PHW60_07250 [Kiritimatiellae bacterium]|nr:hypothetical protein [Kiritimatiellia bacterium]